MGGGCSQGWVLRLCHCLQVLELEVWEQVSAGTPLPRVCQDGEGAAPPAEVPCGEQGLCHEAGPVPRGVSPPLGDAQRKDSSDPSPLALP